MEISVYSTANDAIVNEFTLFEGMFQALRFADEFIFVDGGSTDGTLEQMKKFADIDSRIKIYENHWEERMKRSMFSIQKNVALSHCTKDWCLLMDADEVYSDEFVGWWKELKEKAIFFPDTLLQGLWFDTQHFYGKYNVKCLRDPLLGHKYYKGKIYAVRNGLGIHHGNANGDPDGFVDNEDKPLVGAGVADVKPLSVYHYGHVRSSKVYLKKKNAIERRFHLDWKDLERWDFEEIMAKCPECFEESLNNRHPKIMRKRIEETVDEKGFVAHEKVIDYYFMFLLEHLQRRD